MGVSVTSRSERYEAVMSLDVDGVWAMGLDLNRVTVTAVQWDGRSAVTVTLEGVNEHGVTQRGIYSGPTGTKADPGDPYNPRVGHLTDLPDTIRGVVEEATGLRLADYEARQDGGSR